MPITPDQLAKVEQLRKGVLDIVRQGVDDEYLLATYNGVARYLDKRLPSIKNRVESNVYKNETREIVRQQREARSQKAATPPRKS